jgi:heme exporter protein D
MVFLFALFGWFALVLTGIGVIVALEPLWNRTAKRHAPACPRRRPARLVQARAPALQTAG